MLVHVRQRLERHGRRRPTSPAGRSTCGPSTRRWSCGARSSTTSTTWSAIRVVVESEKDCWAALGAIHAIWAPVQGRFKDYINTPKFNMYQSLHTTVIGLDGKPVEVQIRTSEMHHRAEYGIAAHWGYKAKEDHSSEMAWLQRIADVDRQTDDPIEFLEALKLDLEQDEVYVFTPKGKVIALPARSTPGRLRLRHPHRGRAPLHRGPGQRPPGAARDPAQLGRHGRDLHLEVADRRPVAGLAPDRRLDPGPQQDPPVVLAGSAGRTPSRTAGRSWPGRCAGRACPCRSCSARAPCSRWPTP